MTSARFKYFRETLKLTCESLAQQIGVEAATVQKWESGMFSIPDYAVEFMEKLAPPNPFFNIVRDLGISKTDLLEILSISSKNYDFWLKTNAPVGIVETLITTYQKINELVEESYHYIINYQEMMQVKERVGLPSYEDNHEYNACNPSLFKIFPFVNLYMTFNKKRQALLRAKKIEADFIEIKSEEYSKWLEMNDYPQSMGAEIAFATWMINK